MCGGMNQNQITYDPKKIKYRVLADGEAPSSEDNIACAYDEKHNIKMIVKPMPSTPAKGEVLIRVRAAGICGVSKGIPLISC
jgi:L-iditol 2-dehydrogenase